MKLFSILVATLVILSQKVESASISGVVTADNGGANLSNIQVCVTQRVGFALYECALSDVNGSYTVINLPAENDLIVHVANTDNQPYLKEYYNNIPIAERENSTGVDVSSSNAIDINFSLADGVIITGQITKASDGMKVGHVRFYTVGGSLYKWIIGFAPTGTNTYTAIVPPGDYYALFVGNEGLIDELYDGPVNNGVHCPRINCDLTMFGQLIPAIVGMPVSNINGVLDLGSRISGNISEFGLPLTTSKIVLFYNEFGEYAGFGSTDITGQYISVAGFPSGNYLASNRYLEHGLRVNEVYNLEYISKVYNEINCGEPCNLILGNFINLDGINHANNINFIYSKIVVFGSGFE